MKKVLAFVLTLALAVTAFAMVASAADNSPTQRENAVVVATSNGKDVAPDSSDTSKFDGQVESGMQITDHFNLTGTDGTTPTVFNVQGADDSTQGYFLYLAPGATTPEKIPATFANGTATATFPGDGEVVFVSNLGADEVYIFIEGMGQEWVKGSGKDATFKTNGDYSDFTGIQVDGKDVDAANYTSKSGSTYITLKAAYLETLELGKHTLTAVYATHNDPVTDFNIVKTASEGSGSPKTSDNVAPFAALLLVGALAIAYSAKKIFA